MNYLLDTNVLSEAVKSTPDAGVMTRIEQHHEQLATAAPVWHELQYGCKRLPPSRKRELIESYLQTVVLPNLPILAYDEAAAAWHAEQRAGLAALGRIPSVVDGQIASIAKVNGLILVTRNTADFEVFSDLAVESWHSD